MALNTGGTAATTTLQGIQLLGNAALPGTNIQNIAAVNALIKQQNAFAGTELGTLLSPGGILKLPEGRGVIQMKVGDWIFVDPTSGWPIVVSALAVTGGGFVHS